MQPRRCKQHTQQACCVVAGVFRLVFTVPPSLSPRGAMGCVRSFRCPQRHRVGLCSRRTTRAHRCWFVVLVHMFCAVLWGVAGSVSCQLCCVSCLSIVPCNRPLSVLRAMRCCTTYLQLLLFSDDSSALCLALHVAVHSVDACRPQRTRNDGPFPHHSWYASNCVSHSGR